MRTTTLLLFCLTACSNVPGPVSPAHPGGGVEADVRTPAEEPFTRALDAVLARGSWQALRVDTECRDETGRLRAVQMFGTGVGIWDHERQFAVPRERLLGVLEALRRAGFGAMPESFGGDNEPDWRLEMTCRLQVALDAVEKQSYQLSRGEQSAGLQNLAAQILAVGQELGPSGVAAASLEDGLDKLARGELAPEALTLQFQRQPEDPRSSEGGWILRIEGGEARLSFFSPGTGWTDPRRVRLSAAEFADFARVLEAARPEELPANLYSSWYQDLEIRVLNRKQSLQARRFANLTAETHGEKQSRFDQLITALEDLERRLAR